MAVNEDEQSLHNNSAHSTGSKNRVKEEGDADEEAVVYSLLGLKIDGGGLDNKKVDSLALTDDKAWGTNDSVHSKDKKDDSLTFTAEEKTWDSMDSVHSRCSTVASQYFSAGNSGSDDSFNYNDSNDSFASFGDSFNELSSSSITEIKDGFKDLSHEKPKPPPPRRAPLMKQNSLRFQRGASFRGSLSLIEEKSSEFEPA
jgi:hypothetical protein